MWESERKTVNLVVSVPAAEKRWESLLRIWQRDEFELLSPSVEMVYQLRALIPKSDQNNGNRNQLFKEKKKKAC